jgi:hypothetical protein
MKIGDPRLIGVTVAPVFLARRRNLGLHHGHRE